MKFKSKRVVANYIELNWLICDFDEYGVPSGLWPEEVVEKILEIKNAKI